MSQNRSRHKRRTFPCPQPMWDAFKNLAGEGNVHQRLLMLIALDLQVHGDDRFTLAKPGDDNAPGTESRGRSQVNDGAEQNNHRKAIRA